MTLTLSVLRCPDRVAPETRRVTGGEYSIGRGVDNDWTLPDPDRVLSKRHCVLAYRSGGWQLADVSSNGTYLNRDQDPLGQGAPRGLRDGDRVRLGSYEIEVRIAAHADTSEAASQPFADPFGDDPFAPQRGGPFAPPAGRSAPTAGFGADPLLGFGQGANQSVTLPADFDPLGADFEAPFTGPTQPDHTPALEHRFRVPTPMATQPSMPMDLDDWDLDLAPPVAPAAASPQAALPLPIPAPSPPVPAQPVIPVPPAVPPPPLAYPALPAGDATDPFAEKGVAEVAFEPPVAAPSRSQPAAAPGEGDLMAAFLCGAGMEDARPADPAAAMEALGAAFRATVGGLRAALIARAAVKGEFRIEQTMIRARGNNPLKFSAGDDDAMAALLGIGRNRDMRAADAIAEVLRDMRLHELATMAAMQTAIRALLDRFDPAKLRAIGEQAGGVLPGQKRARAYEAFEKLHGEVCLALVDDFDSVFGRAFARAYEQALREVEEGSPSVGR